MVDRTLVVTALIAIVGIFLFSQSPNQFIEVNLFDENGEQISESLSVVEGIEGVAFVNFDINIENLDSVPLTFSVVSMTPLSVESAIPTNSITIQPDQTDTLTTDLIDIQQFEGMVQEFCITVESAPITALRERGEKTGCVSLNIEPNPEGEFNVEIDSDLTEPGINPSCEENWVCSEWSECNNQLQTRACTDTNECGTSENMPEQEQFCEGDTFETSAVNGEYNEPGVTITLNGITYQRGGVSSYNCPVLSEVIFTTPEGNDICTRSGYDVSERVYLKFGTTGIIFES